MRVRVGKRLVVAAVAGVVVSSVPAVTSASEPQCRTLVNQPATTVGVAGQPVVTTPRLYLQVCVTTPEPTVGGVPEIRIEPRPYNVDCGWPDTFCSHAFWLDQVGIPPSEASISISYVIGSSSDSRSVTIPITGTGGSSTCLFYRGQAEYNPGGCLLFVEH